MKAFCRALLLSCVLLVTTGMSPANKYLQIKEDSHDGLVVFSVTHGMSALHWSYRKLGDTRTHSFASEVPLRGDEIMDGTAQVLPLVLPQGEYELVLFTAFTTMPKLGRTLPCWQPSNWISIRFSSVAGKATYVGNLDLATEETEDGGTYELAITERGSTLSRVSKHYLQLKPQQWRTQLAQPRDRDLRGELTHHCKALGFMTAPLDLP